MFILNLKSFASPDPKCAFAMHWQCTSAALKYCYSSERALETNSEVDHNLKTKLMPRKEIIDIAITEHIGE